MDSMNATAQSLVVSSPRSDATTQADAYLIDFKTEEQRRINQLAEAKDTALARLQAYQPYGGIAEIDTDKLNGRFIIHGDRPIPELSYGNVQAFSVTDEGNTKLPLYAIACAPYAPFREDIYRHIRFDHPHLVRFYDEGVVYLTALDAQVRVFIFERPQGKTLAEFIERHQSFPDDIVIQQIIRPIASVLEHFADRGISHCRVNPHNIFIGERTILGECIGEPAGYSQEYIYEPPERIEATQEGKGHGSVRTDMYALGVITLELVLGIDAARNANKDTFTHGIMQLGAYNYFLNNRHVPESIADFVKGTLCENMMERWPPNHVPNWLTGKRFNGIIASAVNEAARTFEFDGKEYHNGRTLAYAFFHKWYPAQAAIRSPMLARWIEQNLHKKELAHRLRSIVEAYGGETGGSNKQSNELVARALLILDPFSPIRFNQLAFHIDGIGPLLCEAVRQNRQQDILTIIDCFQNDIASFASEMQRAFGNNDVPDALFKIDKVRHRVRSKILGFSIERAMYDLNPMLPCLSPKLKEYHITDIAQLLFTLDKLASSEATNFDLVDTHIAAFAASHANLNKDVSFHDFQRFSHIKDNKELIVIAILAKAQEKAKIKNLYGLAHWAAYRLIESCDTIHSLKIRRTICEGLLFAAQKGNLGMLISAYANKGLLDKDTLGFKQSAELFHNNMYRIQKLRSYEFKRKQARAMGSSIATMIANVVVLTTFYVVLKSHFHL